MKQILLNSAEELNKQKYWQRHFSAYKCFVLVFPK